MAWTQNNIPFEDLFYIYAKKSRLKLMVVLIRGEIDMLKIIFRYFVSCV